MPGCRNKEQWSWCSFIKPAPFPPSHSFASVFSVAASRSFTPTDSAAAVESIVRAHCPKRMAAEDTEQTKGGLGLFA